MVLLEELVDTKRLDNIRNSVKKYGQLSEDVVRKTFIFANELYNNLISMPLEKLKWDISSSDLYSNSESKGKASEIASIYGRISLDQALSYARIRYLELNGSISEEIASNLRVLVYLKYEKEGAKKVMIDWYKGKPELDEFLRKIDMINEELAKYCIVNSLVNFNQNIENLESKRKG